MKMTNSSKFDKTFTKKCFKMDFYQKVSSPNELSLTFRKWKGSFPSQISGQNEKNYEKAKGIPSCL